MSLLHISTPALPDIGPSRFRLQPDRRAEAARRRRLQRDFDEALASGAVAIHLRPRIALHGGGLIGAEARLRWTHRRQGILRSTALFALAEQSGLSDRLAGWALQQCCAMAARWAPSALLISVRLPPALHEASALHHHLALALEASGLAPERLELRLAEADLAELDAEELLGLCAVRDLGVGVALEHFGSGATSLATLRRLPISTLTLSNSLLRHVPQEREDAAILRAILAAAAALGLETVADGVERATQRDLLAQAGCDAAQGIFFAPDGPESSLARWMTQA